MPYIENSPRVSVSGDVVYDPPPTKTAVPVFIFSDETAKESVKELHASTEIGHSFGLDGDYRKDTLRAFFDCGGAYCYVCRYSPEDLKAIADPTAFMDKVLADCPDATIVIPLFLYEATEKSLPTYEWGKYLADAPVGINLFFLLDAVGTLVASKLRTGGAADVLKRINGLTAMSTMAAYAPGLAYDSAATSVFPSAVAAATMQRVDIERGIWCAPANVPLHSRLNVDMSPATFNNFTLDQQQYLNPIRLFRGQGARVWGCRTLAGGGANAAHRYVQTVRTVRFIESELKARCRFAVFEPNNAITWAKVHGVIYAWLHDIWKAGALQGEEAGQAFKVSIGEGASMTADDIDDGCLIASIDLALHWPTEYIKLALTLHTQSSASGER